MRSGTGFAIDIRIRTARGNMRWLRLTADIEKDESGTPVRIFGSKQDITDERAAQEKLRSLRAELIHLSRRSAMNTMAATLAHELNQPLTAIGNYVAGMRRAMADPDLPPDHLEQCLAAIEKCAFGAGDIIEITPARGPTLLLPFNDAVVPTVDLDNGHIVLVMPQEIDGDSPSDA